MLDSNRSGLEHYLDAPKDLSAKRKRARHRHFDATDYVRVGMRWIQLDDNFSVQDLLRTLFREL